MKKGITLVALVVTIIILLILATVTIGLVLGNDSIFGRATEGKVKTELAQLGERYNSAGASILMDYAIGTFEIITSGTDDNANCGLNETAVTEKFEGLLSATDYGEITTANAANTDNVQFVYDSASTPQIRQYRVIIPRVEGNTTYYLHYLLDFLNNKSNFDVSITAAFPSNL